MLAWGTACGASLDVWINHSNQVYRPFGFSVLFVVRNHALTRVATHCRCFAPGVFAHPIEAQGCH